MEGSDRQMNFYKLKTFQRWAACVVTLSVIFFLVCLLPKPYWNCNRSQSNQRITNDGFGLFDILSPEPKGEGKMSPPKLGLEAIDPKTPGILRMFPIYSIENNRRPRKKTKESGKYSDASSDSLHGSKSPVKVFKLQNFDFTNFSRLWVNEKPISSQISQPQNNYWERNKGIFRISDLKRHQKLPDCVQLSVPRDGWPTKICVHYPKDDNFISNRIRDTGEWEMNFAFQMGQFFQKNPNSQLLDLGCNIGVFTLFAASLGKPVLAVDILPSNLALIQLSIATNDEMFDEYEKPDDVHDMLQSLGYNRENRPRYSELITTVHNAVYSRHAKMYVYLKEDLNLGGTEVKEFDGSSDSVSTNHNNNRNNSDRSMSIQSTAKMKDRIFVDAVCLDDLIPYVRANRSVFLKMDIEGSEPNALLCAGKFFMYVDVKLVLMEILFSRYSKDRETMIKFLLGHGMLPAKDTNGLEFLDPNNMSEWPENIFWIRVR